MEKLEADTIVVICAIAAYFAVPLGFYFAIISRLLCDDNVKGLLDQREAERSETRARETTGQPSLAGGASRMIEDPPQVLISFKGVKYSVPIGNNEQKMILKGIDAYFKPQTLSAIMGPSGCGKSTLLDILADQKEYGKIEGSILINGKPRTKLFRRSTAYVMQFDCLYENLTVRETLWFVTELKLRNTVRTIDKLKVVRETMEELDLTFVADTRIGGDSGGLSGGQKRRVTVAIELITNPGLILLDEPTSGLDAYGSLKVCTVLKSLAERGRTVVCTIHQPRADIFKLFDYLLLMKLGETMFFGRVGEIFPYFESCGIEIDRSVNPADFIVDLTHEKTPEELEMEENYKEAIARGENVDPIGPDLDQLVESWRTSDLKRATDVALIQIVRNTFEDQPPPLETLYDKEERDRKYVTNYLKQTYTLTRRAMINDFRNPAYISGWVLGIVMMLFYGMLYSAVESPSLDVDTIALVDENLTDWGACTQSPDQISQYVDNSTAQSILYNLTECSTQQSNDELLAFARSSLLYQLLAAMYFAEAPMVSAVYLDKTMFFREHASRSYSSGAYVSSWVLKSICQGFLKGAIYPLFVYFSAQLPIEAEPYFLFSLFLGTMSVAGSSVALLCSTFIPSLETATVTYVVINIVAQNLSGYFLAPALIPPWFKWLYYMNFFRYTFEGTIASQQMGNLDGAELQSTRDFSWRWCLIALMMCLIFQITAFLATWLSHRSVSESPSLGVDTVEETGATSDAERGESSVSSSIERASLMDKFRDVQQRSVRGQFLKQGSVAANLAVVGVASTY